MEDCGLRDTKIELPWELVAHSCVTHDTAIYICSNFYYTYRKKCVKFDGKQVMLILKYKIFLIFFKFTGILDMPSGHAEGGMVEYDDHL